jgi:hypothetical protein
MNSSFNSSFSDMMQEQAKGSDISQYSEMFGFSGDMNDFEKSGYSLSAKKRLMFVALLIFYVRRFCSAVISI